MNKILLVGLVFSLASLVTLSMLFSISESAFLSLNRLRLRVLCKKNDKRAVRTSKLLEKKEILINTLLIANDLVNILLSSIVTVLALHFFGNKGVGYATFTVTLILLIFGEITPKTLSTRNPDGIAYSLSLFVKIVVNLLRPIVFIFTVISRIVLKFRGISVENEKQSYTEEDIKTFLDVGSESGVLEHGEKNMMNRVFKFTDLEACDIMTPRTSIVGLHCDSTYSQVIELAKKSGLSHFPVYRENLDDIIGVLYLKDLLKIVQNFNESEKNEFFDIKKILRESLFIPGTNKLSSAEQLFRENHQSFAVVIDEYSGTDGILTKDDICRAIFGTSQVEKAQKKSLSLDGVSEKNEFVLSGSTLLVELKDLLGFSLESNINETLAGWIIEQLGRLADPYDSVIFKNVVFTVEEVKNRRIETVKILKKVDKNDE